MSTEENSPAPPGGSAPAPPSPHEAPKKERLNVHMPKGLPQRVRVAAVKRGMTYSDYITGLVLKDLGPAPSGEDR